MRASIDILDSRFLIDCEDPELLRYSAAFDEAYEPGARASSPHVEYQVRVRRTAALLGDENAPIVSVHRTKHAYWNLDARLVAPAPRRVWWWTRGIVVTFDAGQEWLDIDVVPGWDASSHGEAIFHALRGIALYARSPGLNLLHASAIDIGGRSVIFVGQTSAGKTTIMTRAALRHEAHPHANDRVAIDAEGATLSWPSYSSYCEGTLLDYPELRRGAALYERDDCWFRTQRWPRPLERRYTKDCKRVYPMRWFRDACGRGFVRRSRLAAVVLSRLDTDLGHDSLRVLDPSSRAARELVRETLAYNSFDGAEPSFQPWHGLSLAPVERDVDGLVANLYQWRIPLWSLEVRPANVDTLDSYLDRVKGTL